MTPEIWSEVELNLLPASQRCALRMLRILGAFCSPGLAFLWGCPTDTLMADSRETGGRSSHLGSS